MVYFSKYDYTIIRKHWIVLFFKYLKSLIYFLFALLLYYICIKYRFSLWEEVVNYVFFPLIFILLNYAFFKLILSYIKFYNDLLIISDWQIIVINASLLFVDDIEFIDISKVTKMDTFTRWLLANIIWFWNLVIEQQRDQVREFNYIPEARKALHIIKAEKEKIMDKEAKNKLNIKPEVVNDNDDYEEVEL